MLIEQADELPESRKRWMVRQNSMEFLHYLSSSLASSLHHQPPFLLSLSSLHSAAAHYFAESAPASSPLSLFDRLSLLSMPCLSPALFLAMLLLPLAAAEFNNTVCPFFWEIYAPKVPTSFNLDRFVGLYYELALHDVTQYPLCPDPSCITSNKSFVTDVGDGRSQIRDAFTLSCYGKPYPVEYFFNVTEYPGYLDGFVVDAPPIWYKLFTDYYPDTIVDFEIDEETGLYEWVIEFQCTEDQEVGGVDFTGFNFYSRHQNPGQEYIDMMIQRARDRGLSIYLDQKPGIFMVPMNDC